MLTASRACVYGLPQGPTPVHHLPVSPMGCGAEGEVLPAVPDSGPPPTSLRPLSTWRWRRLPPSPPLHGKLGVAHLFAFCVFLGQMGEGFWWLWVQAGGPQSHGTYGCECPHEPRFADSFNWGKNLFGPKSIGHCDFKGSISEIKHFPL